MAPFNPLMIWQPARERDDGLVASPEKDYGPAASPEDYGAAASPEKDYVPAASPKRDYGPAASPEDYGPAASPERDYGPAASTEEVDGRRLAVWINLEDGGDNPKVPWISS